MINPNLLSQSFNEVIDLIEKNQNKCSSIKQLLSISSKPNEINRAISQYLNELSFDFQRILSSLSLVKRMNFNYMTELEKADRKNSNLNIKLSNCEREKNALEESNIKLRNILNVKLSNQESIKQILSKINNKRKTQFSYSYREIYEDDYLSNNKNFFQETNKYAQFSNDSFTPKSISPNTCRNLNFDYNSLIKMDYNINRSDIIGKLKYEYKFDNDINRERDNIPMKSFDNRNSSKNSTYENGIKLMFDYNNPINNNENSYKYPNYQISGEKKKYNNLGDIRNQELQFQSHSEVVPNNINIDTKTSQQDTNNKKEVFVNNRIRKENKESLNIDIVNNNIPQNKLISNEQKDNKNNIIHQKNVPILINIEENKEGKEDIIKNENYIQEEKNTPQIIENSKQNEIHIMNKNKDTIQHDKITKVHEIVMEALKDKKTISLLNESLREDVLKKLTEADVSEDFLDRIIQALNEIKKDKQIKSQKNSNRKKLSNKSKINKKDTNQQNFPPIVKRVLSKKKNS